MAAIDFPASPTNGQLFTPANGITYRWLTAPGIWAVANGPVDTVIASDTPPASPVPNQLWFNASLAMLYVYYDDGNSQQWVPSMPVPAPVVPGTVVQTVSMQTGAMVSGSTTVPIDDTIPQITEGIEVMTLAITPKSATSRLIVEVTANLSNTAAGLTVMMVALFQDSGANAIAVAPTSISGAGALVAISFKHTMISGTISSTTFRVRGGGSAAGTTTLNGASGGRLYGGAYASSIVIQEVAT